MADADKSKDDQDEVAAPKSKLVPMLLVVNTLMVVGVLAFTLLKKPAAPAAAPAAAAAAEEHGVEKADGEHSKEGAGGPKVATLGPIVALENFIVQLRAIDAEKYAHITIEIELSDERDKDIVSNRMPSIRDTVIGYLADRTADELRGSQGMAAVKEEVLTRLREAVPGRRIRNVYLTSFIVQ